MAENKLSADYWEARYFDNKTSWDIGEISRPIKEYFEGKKEKNRKILIPGAGNGHEAVWLHCQGFTNFWILDFAQAPLDNFKKKCPSFPSENLLKMNFFDLNDQFDLIVEQTLFCALEPSLRAQYAEQIHSLLKPGAQLIGVLFNRNFDAGPPFGGTELEYRSYFEPFFPIVKMSKCYNSIPPRKDSELFIQIQKGL